MNYRLVKQQGTERELLDRITTEYDIDGMRLLVFRGEMPDGEFMKFANDLNTVLGDESNDVFVMQVAPDEDVESYRIERVDDAE